MIKKINISGLEIGLDNTNAKEVIHMGGPGVGDVWLNDKLIIQQCLWGNLVFDSHKGYLFFAQYHKINYYEYFTINFYQIISGKIVEFTREFDMLYLGELVGDHELEIFHAFHNKNPHRKQIFDFDEEDFVFVN